MTTRIRRVLSAALVLAGVASTAAHAAAEPPVTVGPAVEADVAPSEPIESIPVTEASGALPISPPSTAAEEDAPSERSAPATTVPEPEATSPPLTSSMATATPFVDSTGLPSAPQNFRIAERHANTMYFAWDAPATGAPIIDYVLRYRRLPDDAWDSRSSGGAQTIPIMGLATASTYEFQVVAWNSQGASEPASLIATEGTPPNNASISSATALVNGVTVYFYALHYGSPATHFTIERALEESGPWSTIATDVPADPGSYTDTGLAAGTYYYRVVPWNQYGAGPPSAPRAAWAVAIPSAPVGVTAVPANRGALVSWSPPANPGSTWWEYLVERAPASGGSWTLVARLPIGQTSYFASGLANGTTYRFRVTAAHEYVGETSAVLSVTPRADAPMQPPAAPWALIGTGEPGAISLSWRAPVWNGGANISDYVIYYAPVGGTWRRFEDGASTRTDARISGLQPGTSYYVIVYAVNAAGMSAHSDAIAARTPVPPSAPRNVTASAGPRQLTISWNTPADEGGAPVDRYRVYFAPVGGSWREWPEPLGRTHSMATITGLDPGTTYYAVVYAENGAGLGAQSATASGTTHGAPGKPRQLMATADSGTTARLSWLAPTNANETGITHYVIYYAVEGGTWGPWYNGYGYWGTPGDTLTQLTPGKRYFFIAFAVNASGMGPASDYAEVTMPGVEPPSAPRLLRWDGLPGQSITLRWEAPQHLGGAPVSDYLIYYAPIGGEWKRYIDAVGPQRYATLSELPPGQYYAVVYAVHAGGTSPASEPVVIAPPAAATVLSTTVFGDRQLGVYWQQLPTTGGFNGPYEAAVYYAPIGGAWQVQHHSALYSAYAELHGLSPGLSYYVFVVLSNAGGDSAISNVVVSSPIPTPPPLSAPTITNAATGSRLSVWWLPPESTGMSQIRAYHVYYARVNEPWRHGATVEGYNRFASLEVPTGSYQLLVFAENDSGLSPQSNLFLANHDPSFYVPG